MCDDGHEQSFSRVERWLFRRLHKQEIKGNKNCLMATSLAIQFCELFQYLSLAKKFYGKELQIYFLFVN